MSCYLIDTTPCMEHLCLGQRIDAVAEGFSEANSGQDNAQVLRYCADRGKVYIRSGDYPLHNFQLKDGDDIIGSGYNTNIISNNTVAIAFGNWSGNSFTGSTSEYSVIDTPSIFSTTITFPTATDSDNYTVGEPVAIWSAAGRTNAIATFIPAFIHISEVISVQSGQLTIKHPIYRDTPIVGVTPSEMRVTSAAQMGGYSNLSPTWARDVVLSNMSFTATGDSWSRFGGALRANVNNIWVRDSDSIFVQNGIAYSNFSFRSCQYHNFALDMAMGCQYSNIVMDDVYCDTSYANENPAIAFAESCHDNYVQVKQLNMVDSYLKDAAVSFKTGSANNTFEGNVFAHSTRRLVKQHHTADFEGILWDGHRGNAIRNSNIRGHSSQYLLSVGSETAGEMSKFSAENTHIQSADNTNSQFYIYGSKVDISGTVLDGAGDVRVDASCQQVNIRDVKCLQAPTTNNIAGQVISDGIILNPDTWS